MDKMISNVFENDWNFPVRSKTNWSPPVDVKETDDSFTLTADIPGLTKKEVNVNVSDGIVSISGERKLEDEKKAIIITIVNADMVLFHGRSIYLKL
jgi:Molecular chaperone (small heat shock protein)